MKVLLINPPLPNTFTYRDEYLTPTALLFLASALVRSKFETKIVDLNLLKPWLLPDRQSKDSQKETILSQLSSFLPELIGITCMASEQFENVLQISEWIKAAHPHLPIVIGGMHATIHYSDILQNCPNIDYIALGEGEKQLVNIAAKKSLRDIAGIAFRTREGIVATPREKYIDDLDFMPAYQLIDFKDYEHDLRHWYNPKNLQFNISIPLVSSRSCHKRCCFCSSHVLMGTRPRMRSPENVVDEIRFLYEKHGHRRFAFVDDNISFNKERVLSICNQIIIKNLNIEFETQNAIMISTLDQEILDALVSAGLVRCALPIESGSDYIRNTIIGKNLKKEKIYEVAKLTKRYPNLRVKALLVAGLPEETHETLEDTYSMINDLEFDEVFLNKLAPYPGTRVFDQAVKDNLFIETINIQELWKGNQYKNRYNTEHFYIKPYQLEIEELKHFVGRFNLLLTDIKQRKKRTSDGRDLHSQQKQT